MIRIAAITLASDSAITLARFRPSKVLNPRVLCLRGWKSPQGLYNRSKMMSFFARTLSRLFRCHQAADPQKARGDANVVFSALSLTAERNGQGLPVRTPTVTMPLKASIASRPFLSSLFLEEEEIGPWHSEDFSKFGILLNSGCFSLENVENLVLNLRPVSVYLKYSKFFDL